MRPCRTVRPIGTYEAVSVPAAAYLVGTVAMFWVFERTYSFLG